MKHSLAVVACFFAIVAVLAGAEWVASDFFTTNSAPRAVETIYIQNKSPRYMSNQTIERDIPAWEKSANADFSPVWDTPQVDIDLLHGPAPRNTIVATFQKSGSIQGALAYHTITRGHPAIVVYTGTGDYYGYSNSVSFTHELFETLADAYVSDANMGTAPSYYVGSVAYPLPPYALFVNEVSDPVEAYQYQLDGVAISDFVTPNYFGDGVSGGLDYMNILTHPFQIAHGGYQIVWIGGGWQEITNFRGAGRDANGFLKGERGLIRS